MNKNRLAVVRILNEFDDICKTVEKDGYIIENTMIMKEALAIGLGIKYKTDNKYIKPKSAINAVSAAPAGKSSAIEALGYRLNTNTENDIILSEAIKRLQFWLKVGSDGMTEERYGYIQGWFHKQDVQVFEKAIDGLEKLEKIQDIINIDNFTIQEDVLKYKMICEVMKL